MEAKVTWQGRMSFSGTSDSNFGVPLDTEPAFGGDNQGFRPLELMAVSLAGCTAMDVISIMRKKRQAVTAFEVRVHADRSDEHPRVFTQVRVEYIITGRQVSPAAVERAIELSAGQYCPAQAMLSKSVKIDHQYQIIETA